MILESLLIYIRASHLGRFLAMTVLLFMPAFLSFALRFASARFPARLPESIRYGLPRTLHGLIPIVASPCFALAHALLVSSDGKLLTVALMKQAIVTGFFAGLFAFVANRPSLAPPQRAS